MAQGAWRAPMSDPEGKSAAELEALANAVGDNVAYTDAISPILPDDEGEQVKPSAGGVNLLRTVSSAYALQHNTSKEVGVAFDQETAMRIFNMMDKDGDGRVAEAEMERNMSSNPELRQMLVDSDDMYLQAFLEPHSRAEAFDHLDADDDEVITREEWVSFLENLRADRKRYLKRHALLSGRPLCYWGKGTGDDPHVDFLGLVESGRVPKGYFDDLYYYASNHHPILSLFLRDKDHPQGTIAKLIVEIEVLLFSMAGAALVYVFISNEFGIERSDESSSDVGRQTNAQVAVWGFGTLFVTIPSLMYAEVARYMTGCPCLIMKRRTPISTAIRYVGITTGRIIALTLFAIAVLSAIWGFAEGRRRRGRYFLLWWILGRSQAYVIWPILLLMKEFNLYYEVPVLGIGTWQTQREQTFQRHAGHAYDAAEGGAAGQDDGNMQADALDNVQVTVEDQAIYEASFSPVADLTIGVLDRMQSLGNFQSGEAHPSLRNQGHRTSTRFLQAI